MRDSILTAEITCSWAERYNFVPFARVVIQSIPPISTALEADFTGALVGMENWCKRRVFLGELDLLRPTLNKRPRCAPDRTFTTCVTYGVVERDLPPSVRRSAASSSRQELRKSVPQRMFSVRFVWQGPGKRVSLGGSFNNWTTKLLLRRNRAGCREIIIRLPLGQHDYRFLVDGEWQVNPQSLVVLTDKGKTNRVYVQYPPAQKPPQLSQKSTTSLSNHGIHVEKTRPERG